MGQTWLKWRIRLALFVTWQALHGKATVLWISLILMPFWVANAFYGIVKAQPAGCHHRRSPDFKSSIKGVLDSLKTDAIADLMPIRTILPRPPLPYRQAVERALTCSSATRL